MTNAQTHKKANEIQELSMRIQTARTRFLIRYTI